MPDNNISGATLSRRRYLRGFGVAGAGLAVGGSVSSGTASAQTYGDSACVANDDIPCVSDLVDQGLNYLFGSGDETEEQVNEYLENQEEQLLTEFYTDAVERTTQRFTTLTWITDHAEMLEGRAYIRGLSLAFEAQEDEGADQQQMLEAAQDGVDEIFTTPYRELINEFHHEINNIRRGLERIQELDGTEVDGETLSLNYGDFFRYRIDDNHTGWNDGQFDDPEFAGAEHTDEPDEYFDVTYELFNGEEVTLESVTVGGDAQMSQEFNQYYRNFGGLIYLSPFTPWATDYQGNDNTSSDLGHNESELGTDYSNSGSWTEDAIPIDQLGFQVAPHSDIGADDHWASQEIQNEYYGDVYSDVIDSFDIHAEWLSTEMWENTADQIIGSRSTALDNIETFINESYDDIVAGDITSEDIQSLETMVEDASDEEPFAWANVHLSMLGYNPSTGYTTVEFGDRVDYDSENEEHPDDPDYNIDEDPLLDFEAEGTLHVESLEDTSLEVGETYTAQGFEEDTTVRFTYGFETEDGDEDAAILELEDDREFTITEANTVEDGEPVELDEVPFSSGMPTETPADYDELNNRLDELEEYQQETLDRQLDLADEFASEDDSGVTFPSVDTGGIDWLFDEYLGVPVWGWGLGGGTLAAIGTSGD